MQKNDWDIIDEDLYEEIDPEEMYELVQIEREKLLEKERNEKKEKKRFPKWIGWLIAIAMLIQVIAILPQTFSIPAIDFLKISTKLLQDDTVQQYRKAVVVIEGENNKGTGFAISNDGYIVTNHHVIEEQQFITVAFQSEGLYKAEVVETFPDMDLALLKVDGEELPFFDKLDQQLENDNMHVLFIGNPLRFNGIANEGELIGITNLESWDIPLYMIDAPIYRGNSGSPVINEEGEVIAVIFATQNHAEHGKIGLAVPIEYLKQESKTLQ